MTEEKQETTYRCSREGDNFTCLEAKQHGYSLESCNNICKAEYFDEMLPKITISKNPLSNIVFGIGKWIGVSQDEYLKYPFDEKYVEMFNGHDTSSRKKLLDEFLDFISYKPNIHIIQNFVNQYNNNYRGFHTSLDKSNIFKGMDGIMWSDIAIKISDNLRQPFLTNPDIVDSQLAEISEDIKQYNFIRYLRESMRNLRRDFFINPVIKYKALYGKTDSEAVSYLMGEITAVINPPRVITDILNALYNTDNTFSGIRISYDLPNGGGHINAIIFDSKAKKIYYIEPHGEEYYRIKVFMDSFRNCFLRGEFSDWRLEFVEQQIQGNDPFCDTWCMLCILSVAFNEEYNFRSLLILFNNLHNGINIVLVWYFSIYKALSEIMKFPGGITIDEYIQMTIKRVGIDKNFHPPVLKLRQNVLLNDLLNSLFKFAVFNFAKTYLDYKNEVPDFVISERISTPIEKIKKIYTQKPKHVTYHI